MGCELERLPAACLLCACRLQAAPPGQPLPLCSTPLLHTRSTRLRPWQDLGVDVSPRLATLAVEEPPKRTAGVILASPAELVDRLRNEAKVL